MPKQTERAHSPKQIAVKTRKERGSTDGVEVFVAPPVSLCAVFSTLASF